ncbi:unnamed protein product [Phytomonas sp. Hart1]|nr:unnamed protein product [Phytomonas sp. Hart1]|eukprot:CCW71465.1 unnamed protein product [Phytomonas sp. isolate Hart1]
MNTRRKFLEAKLRVPSTKWHLMNEAYYIIFLPEWREHVEYWYNLGATGQQRDLFRRICSEIYAQDATKPDPTYSTQYNAIQSKEEAKLLIKYYGKVLTKSGQDRARVWVLHVARNAWRPLNDFRDIFTGCQTIFKNESVLHADYLPPEPQYYPTDRSLFKKSTELLSLELQSKAQQTPAVLTEVDQHEKMMAEKRPTYIVDTCEKSKTFFAKPKNQFDGFNILKTMGYSNESPEKTIAQLRAKQSAYQESETYCVEKDGSTFYKAEPVTSTRQRTAATGNGRILDCVTSDPITHWRVKICD